MASKTQAIWKRAKVTALAAAMAGCAPAQYADQADRDAYRTVRSTQQYALGAAGEFQVGYDPYAAPAATEPNAPSEIRVGGKLIPLSGQASPKLTLEECLQAAFRNSRIFQARKEALYSAALALANSRRSWDFPLASGALAGDAARTVVNEGGEVNSAVAAGDFSLTQRLVNGGVLTAGLGIDLASDLLGWHGTTVGSLLRANVTQPLLRGAWRGLAYETQYRFERDFVFSVLEFERFSQEFAVGIVTRYYSVLRQRDQLENERANIKRLEETVALTKTMVTGGLRSPIEQDEAEQKLLNARVRLQQDEQEYNDSLDRFKVTMGLPTAARMDLDYPLALEELSKKGPLPVPVAEPEAYGIALLSRPDVLRQAAAVRDAQRDVVIAADAFLPALDVTLGVTVPSTPPREAARVQFHRHSRATAASFDYELDQTDNRDAYRNALLARDKAVRDHAEFLDLLQLDIRQAYRVLAQSRQTHEIQIRNVDIAKRRRKLATLQQKEGDASTDDVLRAEEDLRNAQNGLTSALVSYATTRLQFLTTLGLLEVDENGRLHERDKPHKYDRLRGRYPYVAQP